MNGEAGKLTKAQAVHLHRIMREGYDHRLDRAACEGLANLNLCRVVDQEPGCWRVYQSPAQQAAGRTALSSGGGE